VDRLKPARGRHAIDRASAGLAHGIDRDEALDDVAGRLLLARSILESAENRLAHRIPAAPAPEPLLMASLDLPRLHVVTRPSLTPTIKTPPLLAAPPTAPPPPERPKTFEEPFARCRGMQATLPFARPAAETAPPPPSNAAAPGLRPTSGEDRRARVPAIRARECSRRS
jgi:hypothetical protein